MKVLIRIVRTNEIVEGKIIRWDKGSLYASLVNISPLSKHGGCGACGDCRTRTRLVDLAHPARSNRSEDFVRAEFIAG
jgi:hypothetical protein